MPKYHFCWHRFGLKTPAVTNLASRRIIEKDLDSTFFYEVSTPRQLSNGSEGTRKSNESEESLPSVGFTDFRCHGILIVQPRGSDNIRLIILENAP